MEYRSTNAAGWTHHQGDLVSNVASSHGVRLTGGSTGGILEAAGDDTNISLVVRGKGAGAVVVGNSSSPLSVVGPMYALGDFNSSVGVFTHTGSSVTIQPSSVGGVAIGTSSNPIAIAGSSVAVTSTHVNLNSSRIAIGSGASTTALSAIKRHLIQFTVPALSSGGSAESTLTLTGATTNSIFVVQPRSAINSSVTGVDLRVRSTVADEIVLTFANDSLSTLSGSTQSAYLLQFLF
jgi:hypothetical protein